MIVSVVQNNGTLPRRNRHGARVCIQRNVLARIFQWGALSGQGEGANNKIRGVASAGSGGNEEDLVAFKREYKSLWGMYCRHVFRIVLVFDKFLLREAILKGMARFGFGKNMSSTNASVEVVLSENGKQGAAVADVFI